MKTQLLPTLSVMQIIMVILVVALLSGYLLYLIIGTWFSIMNLGDILPGFLEREKIIAQLKELF